MLLHGWGMNGAVWHGIPRTGAHYRLHLVDLPGFGNSPWPRDRLHLPWLAEQVAAMLPEKCHLLGWSLGGLVASQLALTILSAFTPHHRSQLPLLHGPRRVARDCPKVLAGFNQMLAGDFMQTIERFLAIQAMGSEHARTTSASCVTGWRRPAPGLPPWRPVWACWPRSICGMN